MNTRSFKKLSWGEPSPTIAFGNREIHVHPDGHRRISIYEAMLLQGFPDDFVIEGNLSQQVKQVSNAVPPPLARSVASAVRRTLLASS
jgi:DNA (cytosine-5)-methyltransferase 1